MKLVVTTEVNRTVQVKVPRKRVADWLRSLGCHIPEDKLATIYVHSGYGKEDIRITWEIGKMKQEDEVDAGVEITMPEFCNHEEWKEDDDIPF